MSIDGINSASTMLMAALSRRQSADANSPTAKGADAVPEASTGEDDKTYDFTNMTPKRLLEVMNDLIKRGELSLDDTSALVGMIPNPNMPELFGEGAFTKPTNFFEKLKQGISFNESHGNPTGVYYGNLALDALRRWQGAPSGVDLYA